MQTLSDPAYTDDRACMPLVAMSQVSHVKSHVAVTPVTCNSACFGMGSAIYQQDKVEGLDYLV